MNKKSIITITKIKQNWYLIQFSQSIIFIIEIPCNMLMYRLGHTQPTIIDHWS